MKVLVFGHNGIFLHSNMQEIKADIVKQIKDNTGVLLVDSKMDFKGVIELSEKDCKQFGVFIGKDVERGNH